MICRHEHAGDHDRDGDGCRHVSRAAAPGPPGRAMGARGCGRDVQRRNPAASPPGRTLGTLVDVQ